MAQRRREQAEPAALAARDAAADAFYEMDRAQRYVRTQVDAFANLEGGSAATRLRSEFDALNASADSAAQLYIDLLDRFPDLELADYPVLAAATSDFSRLTDALRAVRAHLDAFAASHARAFAQVKQALQEVPARAAAARDAVAAARAAIERVATDGLQPREARQYLAQAERTMAAVDAGAQSAGIPATLRAAGEATHLAAQARASAEALPARRDAARKELVALRTRLQVVENKAGQIEPALSQLRRRHITSSWRDIEGCGRDYVDALERARSSLVAAERQSEDAEQDWDAVAATLARCRDELRRAASAADAAPGRLDALDEAASDPQSPIGRARFAIRDAQRLVMDGRHRPEPEFVRALDTLVARLEASEHRLDVPHPDFWAFLRALEDIRRDTARVVSDIRAQRGRS